MAVEFGPLDQVLDCGGAVAAGTQTAGKWPDLHPGSNRPDTDSQSNGYQLLLLCNRMPLNHLLKQIFGEHLKLAPIPLGKVGILAKVGVLIAMDWLLLLRSVGEFDINGVTISISSVVEGRDDYQSSEAKIW